MEAHAKNLRADKTKCQDTESITDHFPGRFVWNEDTKTLDFVSFSSHTDGLSKRRTKGRPHNNDPSRERVPQIPTVNDGGRQSARGSGSLSHFRAHISTMKRVQGTRVNMENVKQVAFSLLLENRSFTIPMCFLDVLKSKELDEFLATMLLYLDCFFERKSLEKKSKSVMVEKTILDLQLMADMQAKVELSRKKLAARYATLILGLWTPHIHHMVCGKSQVSATYRDRYLYESLYDFFCYVAWVTFSRRNLREILEELWCLLRSRGFSTDLRNRMDNFRDLTWQGTPHPNEGRPTRRAQRRSGLKGVSTQCTPLMVNLLPSPMDKCPHLFTRSCLRKEARPRTKPCDTQALIEELNQQLDNLSFGILGRPLRDFNRDTLIPCSSDEEEEEGREEDSDDSIAAVSQSSSRIFSDSAETTSTSSQSPN